MQQPCEQNSVCGQSALLVHTVAPPGHTVSVHSGGRSSSVWPGQRMQSVGSHSLPHSAVLVHGGHAFGSCSVSASQSGAIVGLVYTSTQPASSHSVQHAKQSQPGGV